MTPEAIPCAKCGTTGGYIPPGARRPARTSALPWGIDGQVCRACYLKLYDHRRRERREPREMETIPTPEEIEARAAEVRERHYREMREKVVLQVAMLPREPRVHRCNLPRPGTSRPGSTRA